MFLAVSLFAAAIISSLRSVHIKDHVVGLVNNHLSKMQSSEWLVTKPAGTRPSAELSSVCETQRAAFIGGIRAWGPTKWTNQFATNILAWASSSWGWCVVQTNGPGNSLLVTKVIPGQEMVVLVPKEVKTRAIAEFHCYSEQQGKVIQMRAYKMPDQILTAFLLHEFGHADRGWLQKKPLSSSEEVLMHELTAAVLDKYSNGEYLHAISKIVARANTEQPNADYVLWNVTPGDLNELNHIVGATGVGREVGRVLVMHHLLTIGFTSIDRHRGALRDKAAYYDWLCAIASGK